jgi:hypothetical protein
MKYPTPEYRSRYARALKAATNLASAAMYRTDRTPAFMPRQLRESMNVPDENLCLLPLAGSYPYGLDRAVRETRTTVLVIEPGSTMAGTPTFYVTVIICRAGKVEWHPARRLWASSERQLFLVPDPEGDEPGGECFALDRGVRAANVPWSNEAERALGLLHGDALLLAP